MKKHLFLPFAASLLIITGCTNELKMQTPEEIQAELASRFDFNGWVKLPLTMNLDHGGYVRIYDRDPDLNPDANPVYSAIVDYDGQYKGTMEVPGGMIGHDAWAVSYGMKVKATVTKNGVTFAEEAASRDINYTENAIVAVCKSLDGYYHDYLKPGVNNTDRLKPSLNIDITTIEDDTEIMLSLIDGGDQLPEKIYYYYYDNAHYPLNSGQAFATPNEFFAKFLDDKYCLTNEFMMNKDGKNVDRVNGAELSDYDKERVGFINERANRFLGTSVKLKYYDDEHPEGTVKFPAGVTVGFMILVSRINIFALDDYMTENPDATTYPDNFYWRNASFTDPYLGAQRVSDKNGLVDNSDWNTMHGSLTRYCSAYKDKEIKDGTKYTHLVYGFEDNNIDGGGDKDYDDIMFLVTTDKDINTDAEQIPEGEIIREGTYCFEDLYPSEGDYDLNDVVLRYTYTVKYRRMYDEEAKVNFNVVTGFKAEFIPYWDGATYTNDFYIANTPQYGPECFHCVYTNNANELNAHFELSGGTRYDEEGNIEEYYGSTFAQSFVGQSTEGIFDGINPFILTHGTDGSSYQVHLTNKRYVEGAGGTFISQEEDPYAYEYHTPNGIFPFAIDVPTLFFNPVLETVSIGTAYSQFHTWASTNGQRANDWYYTWNEEYINPIFTLEQVKGAESNE